MYIPFKSQWLPDSHTQSQYSFVIYGVPLAIEPGWLADCCSMSQQLGALQTHTTDTFLFISHTTNVLLFKFRCNIFLGVRIIKEMPGLVASGTHCITNTALIWCHLELLVVLCQYKWRQKWLCKTWKQECWWTRTARNICELHNIPGSEEFAYFSCKCN